MPRVTPHYGRLIILVFIIFSFSLAVKCNDDINVIKLLAYLGAGFDCASKVSFEV
jgi:diaminopimelate decarboxylase